MKNYALKRLLQLIPILLAITLIPRRSSPSQLSNNRRGTA